MRPRTKFLLLLISLSLALAFTLISFQIQRFGPEFGFLGSDCQPNCLLFKLNAGWPWPFFFDRMGVSVLNVLGSEDEFRLLPFVVDVGFYGVIFAICGLLLTTVRGKLRPGRPPNEQTS